MGAFLAPDHPWLDVLEKGGQPKGASLEQNLAHRRQIDALLAGFDAFLAP